MGDREAVTAPIQREILAWLGIGSGTRVLDAGCGDAAFALLCAAAGARVAAVDLLDTAVEKARRAVADSPHSANVTVAQGDVTALSFASGTFDVVWCSRVLHHVRRPADAARELARVARVGGIVAVREGGVRVRMLPFNIGLGEPGLEERMEAVHARWFAAMQRDTLGAPPDSGGWTRLLRGAGLRDIRARTFVMDALPPFDANAQRWLAKELRRALDWDAGPYGPFLEDADRAVLRAITDVTSPHYALRRDDLHVVVGDTVYAARRFDPVPGRGG